MRMRRAILFIPDIRKLIRERLVGEENSLSKDLVNFDTLISKKDRSNNCTQCPGVCEGWEFCATIARLAVTLFYHGQITKDR